jgi:5'-nucleotidase/UDP-sugar diphosphatase
VVCLENSGGIRTDIPAGDVTLAQVNSVLPFGNT